MKRSGTRAVVLLALCGMVAAASAVQPAGTANTDRPFLNVSTKPESLDLGTAPLAGPLQVDAAFTVNVDTNCKLGPIYVSTSSLKHRSGASIEPQNILVRTKATEGFVAMKNSVAISQPMTGSQKIVVDVKVITTEAVRPAGEYSGVFTFTLAPPV